MINLGIIWENMDWREQLGRDRLGGNYSISTGDNALDCFGDSGIRGN